MRSSWEASESVAETISTSKVHGKGVLFGFFRSPKNLKSIQI